jgi:repressor LexA
MTIFFGLTERQSALLAFIRAYDKAHGYTPSYDEMKVGMGYRSKDSIFRLITGLEERGFVLRIPGRARCVRLAEAA